MVYLAFRSNIDRDALQARQILAAHLIIVDKVSILIVWVENRASMILQSISAHGELHSVEN
jgi:hypothetical protein